MSFKPFTAMATKVPEDTQEMVLAVGAIALIWAHVELGLDMLIGLIDNLPNAPKRKRHPVPLVAKLSAIFVAMRDQPELLPYRGELLQIHSLTATLGEERHAILHGAALSMLEDSKGDGRVMISPRTIPDLGGFDFGVIAEKARFFYGLLGRPRTSSGEQMVLRREIYS
jgi:hypothetical protein